MTDDCTHPPPPETCAYCGKPVVVSVNTLGACVDHIDDAFTDAAGPLTAILMAANEAFGDG